MLRKEDGGLMIYTGRTRVQTVDSLVYKIHVERYILEKHPGG